MCPEGTLVVALYAYDGGSGLPVHDFGRADIRLEVPGNPQPLAHGMYDCFFLGIAHAPRVSFDRAPLISFF